MSTTAQPATPSVDELLKEIDGCKLAIPDFQRDFVWDPADTQDLLVSLLSGYPAGTLLLLAQEKAQFRPRPIETAPKLADHASPTLVLDGQQRLTALYQALRGTGDTDYYIDLTPLSKQNEGPYDAAIYEAAVVQRQRSGKAKKGQPSYATLADQAEHFVLPIAAIGRDELDEWIDSVDDLRNQSNSKEKRKELQRLVRYCERALMRYRFPVVTLPGKTPLDAVCKIFETLNRTGIKLTVFELLT